MHLRSTQQWLPIPDEWDIEEFSAGVEGAVAQFSQSRGRYQRNAVDDNDDGNGWGYGEQEAEQGYMRGMEMLDDMTIPQTGKKIQWYEPHDASIHA